MELTQSEQRFIAAFISTARRDAYMASIHAGLGMNVEQAKAMLASPAVRDEIERLSMAAKCVDGEVVDVKPVHPLTQSRPEKPVNAARRDLLEELRGHVRQAVENSTTANTARPMKKPKILTDKGEIAGSAKEVYDRVQRAKRVNAYPPDPTERDGLPERLERSRAADGITHVEDRGDGNVYLYGKDVATPYQCKQFLTSVIKNEVEHAGLIDITTRLQACALLMKSMGMFDAKTIQREKELDKLLPSSVDDIQAETEKLEAELKRLKA